MRRLPATWSHVQRVRQHPVPCVLQPSQVKPCQVKVAWVCSLAIFSTHHPIICTECDPDTLVYDSYTSTVGVYLEHK